MAAPGGPLGGERRSPGSFTQNTGVVVDGAQQIIDTRALEIAVRAQGNIENHEKLCGERYQRIIEHQQASIVDRAALRREISDRFKDLYKFLWRIALAVLGAFAGGFFFLAWQAIRSAPG